MSVESDLRAAKLTKAQQAMLVKADRLTTAGKLLYPNGPEWMTAYALAKRGLLTRDPAFNYTITDAGRAILAAKEK